MHEGEENDVSLLKSSNFKDVNTNSKVGEDGAKNIEGG